MDKRKLLRILLTAVLLFAARMVTKLYPMPVWGQLCVFLVPYILISYDVIGEAIEEGIEAQPFQRGLPDVYRHHRRAAHWFLARS